MAPLTAKERRDLYSSTLERLAEVIGASGKAEELVKLTTQIVQAAKKLTQDTPDAMKNRSTVILAEFVVAAKKIAQDPRAVDSVSLQKLSSSKKAVETMVKEIDSWLTSQSAKDDTDITLEDILSQTSSNNPRSSVLVTAGGVKGPSPVAKGSSPTESGPIVSEQERKLLNELQRQQADLAKKAEPQGKPGHHGDPEQTLKVVVAGLSRSTSQLMDLAGQKAPTKESLLEPATVLAKMVSILMDLVDCLFVSKFPMRSQVHTFSCMLVDNVVAYGDQSRTEDTASLRLISTQAPALMSALEVMVEQCYKRSQNIRESQQLSLQRNADLHNLDKFGPGNSPRNSPATKKRKEPPAPPLKATQPPEVKEFEVCVMICTNVAVDNTTSALLNKGTEITLKATPTTNILDIRGKLAQRTNIAKDSIQIRYRGDDVLTDDTRVTADNPLPYFMFNLHEPGEEEMSEFRKEQRRKNRTRIDTKDWSRVSSPVAVAIYDYEALAEPGEEDNLEFEEGDLIEIVEKSADGWWTGRVEGSVGVFPASFVEMIQIPKTKEERKRLLKRFQQGTLGGPDIIEQEPPARPPEPKFTSQTSSESSSRPQKLASVNSGNKKIGRAQHSSTGSENSDTSPSPTKMPSVFGKFEQRRASEPVDVKEGKQKKRTSFFKKKHTASSSSSYMPITDDFQRSPILPYKSNRDTRPVIPELEEEMVKIQPSVPMPSAKTTSTGPPPVKGIASSAPPPAFRHLHRPKSSPRLIAKGGGGVAPKASEAKVPLDILKTSAPAETKTVPVTPAEGGVVSAKKRRPPPPPPPYAKKYGAQGLHSLVKRQPSDSADGDNDQEPLSEAPPPPERSTSSTDEETEMVPISMKVTPASPELKKRNSRDEEREAEEDFRPISSSLSMEALLSEFDEFSSTQSLTNGFLKTSKTKAERDYATIPRSELPVLLGDGDDDEEEEEEEEEEGGQRPASVPAAVSTPTVVEDRPCLTPTPLPSGGVSKTTDSTPDVPAPIKPPRSRSKRMKMKKQMLEEGEEGGDETEQSAAATPPSPPTPEKTPPQTPPKLSLAHSEPVRSPQPLLPQPLIPHPPRLQNVGGSSSPRPDRPVFHRPKPPSAPPPHSPKPVENGAKQDQRVDSPSPKPPSPKPPSPKPPSPVVPPRKKRSLKRPPKQPKPEFLPPGNLPPEVHPPGSTKPVVSVKPKIPQMVRTHLAVLEKPQSSSAPVSRTASPDDSEALGKQDASSISTSNLCSSSAESGKGRAKGRTLAYKTAMKCISYLSSDHLVREDRLLCSVAGNSVLIKRLLDAIDNSEEIDLNSLEDAPSVLGLLLSLYDERHLGCVIAHSLAVELSSSMQSADPISVMGGKLEQLDSDHREVLKKLLRLFGRVLKYADKNHTEMADIDRTFGPVIFENIPPAQSERLLSYLISTCDFLIT